MKQDVFAPGLIAEHLSRAVDVLRVPWPARPDSRPLVTPQDVTTVCKVRYFKQDGGGVGECFLSKIHDAAVIHRASSVQVLYVVAPRLSLVLYE